MGLISWGPVPSTDAEAVDRVVSILADIRGAYGAPAWLPDVFLNQAAQNLMADPSKKVSAIASALGYPQEAMWKWECRAASVEACLDQILWNPRARTALLTDTEFLGLSAEVTGREVHVVALIARD